MPGLRIKNPGIHPHIPIAPQANPIATSTVLINKNAGNEPGMA
jgi:hypothetical protein